MCNAVALNVLYVLTYRQNLKLLLMFTKCRERKKFVETNYYHKTVKFMTSLT